MNHTGVNTKALFTAAYKNTPTLLPISIFPMGKLFSDDMISECELPEILVCTNQAKSYGASVILYDDPRTSRIVSISLLITIENGVLPCLSLDKGFPPALRINLMISISPM